MFRAQQNAFDEAIGGCCIIFKKKSVWLENSKSDGWTAHIRELGVDIGTLCSLRPLLYLADIKFLGRLRSGDGWRHRVTLNIIAQIVDRHPLIPHHDSAKDAVASMIRRLAHRNANVQLYTLEVRSLGRMNSNQYWASEIQLANSLSQNCGVKMHRELASRSFTDAVLRLANDRARLLAWISNRKLTFFKEYPPAGKSENSRIARRMDGDVWKGPRSGGHGTSIYKTEEPE